MWQEILESSMPIIVQAVIAIVGIIVSIATKKAIAFLEEKRLEVSNQMGEQRYNFFAQIARDVYIAVEQQFKGQEGVSEEKRKAFNEKILKQLPWLTEADLEHFREKVVGDFNEARGDFDPFELVEIDEE